MIGLFSFFDHINVNKEKNSNKTKINLQTGVVFVIFVSLIAISGPFWIHHVYAANANLFVSAENSLFSNYFAGPQVIEVAIVDSDISSTTVALAEPEVTVNGKALRMVQGVDGNWYGYFADRIMAQAADQTVGLAGFGLDFGTFCSSSSAQNPANPLLSFSDTTGVAFPKAVTFGTNGITSFSNCANDLGIPIIGNVVRQSVAPTPFQVTPEVKVGQIGIVASAWPFVQLYDFTQPGSVVIQYNKGGGIQATTLTFDTLSPSLSLDRAVYPQQSSVHLTITDNMLNIDPTDEDSWSFGAGASDTFYQLFDEDGLQSADGTTGAVDISASLSSLMFTSNGIFTFSGTSVGNVLTIIDNNDQKLPTDDPTTSIFSVGTDGGSIPPGNIPVTFTEASASSGVFINFDENDKSNIVVKPSAPEGEFAVATYAAIPHSILVGFNFATIDIVPLDLEWTSGEEIPVTLVDGDANKNTKIDEDLGLNNPAVPLIPSLRTGTPNTLSGLTLGTLDGSPVFSPVQLYSDRALLVYTTPASIVNGDNLTLTFGTMGDVFDSTPINQANFYGSILFNYDVRSLKNIGNIEDITSIDIALAGVTTNIVAPSIVNTFDNQPLQGLILLDTASFKALTPDTPLTAVFTINRGGGVDAISSGTILPVVADIFGFGFINDGTLHNERIANQIIRLELEETGDNTSTFAGSLEYTMINQLNILDPIIYTNMRTIDDAGTFAVIEGLTGVDSPKVNYNDLGADGLTTLVSDQQAAPAHSGVVSFDSISYLSSTSATVTLEDLDLNTDADLIDIYTAVPPGLADPASDTVGRSALPTLSFGPLGKMLEISIDGERWVDGVTNCAGSPIDGLYSTGFTLIETSPSSGIFSGDFLVPANYCKLSTGTIVSALTKSLSANYLDFRNSTNSISLVSANSCIESPTCNAININSILANPKWGITFIISGTVIGTGDNVMIDWGDGTLQTAATLTSPNFSGSHTYSSADIGPKTITAYFKNGAAIIATSSPTNVTVQKHVTSLSLNLPDSVVETSSVTASGKLVDVDTGKGIPLKSISLADAPANIISDASTNGVQFTSVATPMKLVFCNTCTPNPGSILGGANILHVFTGTTITFPPKSAEVTFLLEDMATNPFTATVNPTGGSSFNISSEGAVPDMRLLQLGLNGGTISITSSDPITGVGISSIRIDDPAADPINLFNENFDSFAISECNTCTSLLVGGGNYFSTGITTSGTSLDESVTATFVQDANYLGSNVVGSYSKDTDTLTSIGGTTRLNPVPSTGAVYTALACSNNDPDGDSDSLCNSWEGGGNGVPYTVRFGGVATPYKYALSGSASGTKNVYVEYDYMTGHSLLAAAKTKLATAFSDKSITLTLQDTTDSAIAHLNNINAWFDTDLTRTNDFDSLKALYFGSPSERPTVNNGGTYSLVNGGTLTPSLRASGIAITTPAGAESTQGTIIIKERITLNSPLDDASTITLTPPASPGFVNGAVTITQGANVATATFTNTGAAGLDIGTELSTFAGAGASSFVNGPVTITQGNYAVTGTFTNTGAAGLQVNTELSGFASVASNFVNGAVTITQGANVATATFTNTGAAGLQVNTELSAFAGAASSFVNGAVTITQGANNVIATFTNTGAAGLQVNTELSGFASAASSFVNGAVTITQGANVATATFTNTGAAGLQVNTELSAFGGAASSFVNGAVTITQGAKNVIATFTNADAAGLQVNTEISGFAAVVEYGTPSSTTTSSGPSRVVVTTIPFTTTSGKSFTLPNMDTRVTLPSGTISLVGGQVAVTTTKLEAKAQAYHYGLGVHAIGPNGCNSPTGLGEPLGNDFIIALGCDPLGESDVNHNGREGTAEEQAGTILHELGHNFNLDHGGPKIILATGLAPSPDDSSQNCKPNHISVMNYARQLPQPLGYLVSADWKLDFSSGLFSASQLGERELNEAAGLRSSTATTPKIVWGAIDPATSTIKIYTGSSAASGAAAIPINWDNDANTAESLAFVPSDINNFDVTKVPGCPATPTGNGSTLKLKDYDEWVNLQFNFRTTPNAQALDGSHMPAFKTAEPTTVIAKSTQNSLIESGLLEVPLRPDTITPSKDSYLRKLLPNVNEGDNAVLFVTYLGSDRTLVAFDQPQIANAVAGKNLQSATLKMYIKSTLDNWGSGRTIEARPLTATWAEGNGYNENIIVPIRGTGSGVTWNCAVDTNINNSNKDCATSWNGGTFGAVSSSVLITNGKTGWVSFDVTGDVNAYLSGAKQNYGWIIKKSDETKTGLVTFTSSESLETRPELVLTFVP